MMTNLSATVKTFLTILKDQNVGDTDFLPS